MMDPKDVGEGQHEEFYSPRRAGPRQAALHPALQDGRASLSIRSIFYVPDAVRTPTCPGRPALSSNPAFLALRSLEPVSLC